MGVRVALDVEQRDPTHALLRHLVQSVVLHQVGQPHLGVAWSISGDCNTLMYNTTVCSRSRLPPTFDVVQMN